VPRHGYRIGLPWPRWWREILNTDAEIGNLGGVAAHDIPSHGLPASAEVTLPPLAAIYFQFSDRINGTMS
jgi:1,4-alpha-glucan branching enzyme